MPTERTPMPEPEELPLSLESSGAEKEAAMERSREERARLLTRIFSRKTMESAVLLTPGIDVAGLAAFAARGETLVGKKLDGRERINYAVAAGFLGLFYAFHLAGMEKEALAARGVAASIGAMEFGPEILGQMRSFAAERTPSLAPFVEKTAGFLADKIRILRDAQHSMLENAGLIGSDPITLDLDG